MFISFNVKACVEVESFKQGPFHLVIDHSQTTVGPIHEEKASWLGWDYYLVFIEFREQANGEIKLLGGEFFPKEVFCNLSDDIFDASTAKRIPSYEGSGTLNNFFVLPNFQLDGHEKGNNLIEDGMIKLKYLAVPLIKDARVERIEGVNRRQFD